MLGVIHLRRPHSGGGGGPVISDFFGRGGLAQDGRPVTFIFKDKKTKFLFVLFSRTQLLNILRIQFEAFKFKECPASPFDKKNMNPVDQSNGNPKVPILWQRKPTLNNK